MGAGDKMNNKAIIYKYDIDVNNSNFKSIRLPIKADYIDTIYSSFWMQKVFIVLNPEENLDCLLHQTVSISFYIGDFCLSEKAYIKQIEKINNGFVLLYDESSNADYERDMISFANKLYFFSNTKERVWKNFSRSLKKKYLYAMMCTISRYQFNYPKNIIINGNNIDGCYDFYCELGFLLNNNQWGYFAWNLDALDDCLIDLPKDTKITWINYKRSHILMDEDASKSMRLGVSFMFKGYTDEIFSIFKQHIEIERID